jgi:hypothetical protein
MGAATGVEVKNMKLPTREDWIKAFQAVMEKIDWSS